MPRDGQEIGDGAIQTRKRRANEVPNTREAAPSVSPIGSSDGAVIGEGHHAVDNHGRYALSDTVSALINLQKERTFCIRAQSRADRSCESFIARVLGYQGDLDEKQRKALFARAATIRRAVEKGGQETHDGQGRIAPDADGEDHNRTDNHEHRVLSVCTPVIKASTASRIIWDEHRNLVEGRMKKLAATLPVHAWQKGVVGFGELYLAVIIGETGTSKRLDNGTVEIKDLGSYDTKERVWKRLGLAVIEGERQQKKTDKAGAAAHGYKPSRRSEVWNLGDSMFKHQWRGDKDEDGKDPKKTDKPVAIQAHAIGPYGAVYAARKAHTETRGWSDAHRDNDARRVMTKALVEDLWRVWRGMEPLA